MFLAGGELRDQADNWARFAVIRYDQTSEQWVFSVRRWHDWTPSHICQLEQSMLACSSVVFDSCCCVYREA